MKKTAAIILAAVMMVFVIAGCSGTSPFVGDWTASSIKLTEGSSVSLSEIGMGGSMVLSIKNDGTFTLKIPNETPSDGKWSGDNNSITLSAANGESKETLKCTLEDGKLVMDTTGMDSFDGGKIIFEKK